MSDSPYNFLPPDDAIALAKKTPIDMKNDLLRLGSGAIANMGWDPRLNQYFTSLPNAANWIPFTGAAESLGAMAGQAYDVFRTLNQGATDKLPSNYQYNLPPRWEWTRAAEEHIGQTEGNLDKMLGAEVDITSPGDVARSGMMHGAGAMVSPVPGGGLTALGKTGKALSYLLPTLEHSPRNAALSGILGLAGGAYQAQKIQDEIAASGLTRDQAREVLATEDAQQAAPPEASAKQPLPASPIQPAAAQGGLTFDMLSGAAPSTRVEPQKGLTFEQLSGGMPQPVGGGLTFDMLSGGEKIAPTYQEGGGYTGMTIQDALVTGGLFVAGLFGARFFHGIGADVTQAARLARLRDPAFVAEVADYNNRLIAQGQPLLAGPEGAPRPPPLTSGNPIREALTTVQNAVQDHTAKVREYITVSGETPQSTDLMNRRWATINNDSMHQTQMRQFMQTGWDERIQFQMSHPPTQTQKRYVAMSPEDRFDFDEGVIARNEIRNRINNQIEYGQPLPLDFKDKDMAYLRQLEARAMAKPNVADLIKAYDKTNMEIPEMGLKYGHFTPADVANMKSKRPEVVYQTDPMGRILQTFGERQSAPYTGVRQEFVPPLISQAQHVEQAIREFRVNEINRQLWHAVERERMDGGPIRQEPHRTPNQPTYGILPEEILNKAREPIVYIRDNGLKAVRVHDPMLYEAYTRQNVTRARAALGMWAAVSRIFAHLTTGVASLATLRVFPIRPAIWTATTMGVNRPAGSVGGLMEMGTRQLQTRLTPKGVPYRGWDPTNYLGAAYAYGAGRIGARAGNIARVLAKDSPNPVNRWFRATIGDAQTDALQGVFDKYYRSSFEFFKRTQGIGSQANMFRTPLPAYAPGKGTPMRMVSNELVPELFMANTWLGRARPPVVKLRSAMEQAYSNMSEASHDWWTMINRGRGKYAGPGGDELLAGDARALTGDFGVGGGNRYVQGLTSTIPYSNIALQGTTRRVQAFVETPAGTTLAYVSSLGTPALISLLTAMGRPDAIDYLENVLSTAQRVSDIILFRNGYPPEQHIKIPLAQEDSWGYGLVLESIAKAMNLAAIKHMPDSMAAWGEFLHDYLHEHITHSTIASIEHGIQRGVGLDWPLLNAAFAFTGKQAHFDVARIMSDIQNGTFGTDTFIRGTGSVSSNANVPQGDGTFDGVEGKKFTDLIANTLGATGATMTLMFNNASRYYAQTGDFLQSLGMAGHDWLKQGKDYNPVGNTLLWENTVRNSMAPPIVEYNKARMAAIRQSQGILGAMRNEGMTGGPRGFQLPLPPGPQTGSALPTDRDMVQILAAVNQLHANITRHVEPRADAIKKQMDDVNAKSIDPEGNRLTPEEKVKWLNAKTREYADVYRTIGGFIDDTNSALTARYGRYIDVGKAINYKGTLDQWPPVE